AHVGAHPPASRQRGPATRGAARSEKQGGSARRAIQSPSRGRSPGTRDPRGSLPGTGAVFLLDGLLPGGVRRRLRGYDVGLSPRDSDEARGGRPKTEAASWRAILSLPPRGALEKGGHTTATKQSGPRPFSWGRVPLPRAMTIRSGCSWDRGPGPRAPVEDAGVGEGFCTTRSGTHHRQQTTDGPYYIWEPSSVIRPLRGRQQMTDAKS